MRLISCLACLVILSGCASTEGGSKRDPWEGMNRSIYGFNDALDRAVVRPAAEGYIRIVPEFGRTGVNNFFGNLNDLNTGVNNLLQGKVAQGASDLGRVAVNSVVGIFGLWDVASPMGLEKHNEDFGQTLGWWGVPSGPYLVVPLFGPSTVRDFPARFVDTSYAVYHQVDNTAVQNSFFVTDLVRSRANLRQSEKVLDEAALDRYSFIRDAWVQRRRHMVYDGKPPKSDDDE